MKHRAKRLSRGHYLYRGYEVICVGYHAPDNKIVWEAVDKDGSGFAHSYSLTDTKLLIDEEIDRIQ